MDGHNKPVIKSAFVFGCRVSALVFLAVGVVCLLLVAGMIYTGGVWAHGIYAEKPIPHLLGGIGALFASYVLFFGIHNTARDWSRFFGKVLLVSLSVAFSLVAGELALRAYYSALANANSMEKFKAMRRDGKPIKVHSTHALAAIIQPSDNLNVMYELRPHLDRLFGRGYLISNADGMRETEDYPLQRLPNSVRIIGIGDSGMFGWDLNQNEDYLAVLEKNLNGRQDGHSYEILNLAVPGYNTRLEVEALRAKGLKYKPDIVIVGWCDNDFSLPFFMIEKENYRRRDVSFLYRLVFNRAPKNNNRTELAPGITLRDHRDFDEELVLPELTTGSDVDRVKAALVDLKAMSEQNGFKVLVFGPLPEICRQICTEVGVPFSNTYDLIPAGKYPKEYLVHWMHPSKDGHRVLAECLEKDLVDRGWLPPRDRK